MIKIDLERGYGASSYCSDMSWLIKPDGELHRKRLSDNDPWGLASPNTYILGYIAKDGRRINPSSFSRRPRIGFYPVCAMTHGLQVEPRKIKSIDEHFEE